MLQSQTVKLIVIDSIAAHFRSDYDGHEMFKRSKHISSIGSILYKYSHVYKVAVVCVNQVGSGCEIIFVEPTCGEQDIVATICNF